MLLVEAVFAGNALVTYNGASPYNARYGTQPAMLPDLTALPQAADRGGRELHRVREVALQKIIESTAVARINRAMRTATTPAGEALDFKPGDLVDFHRPPRSKDSPAWHGPAKVRKNLPQHGQVVLEWNGDEIVCRYPDVRRFMDFGALVWHTGGTRRDATSEVLDTLHHYLSQLPDKRMVTLGYHMREGKWHPTAESRKHPRVTFAMDYAMRNVLQLTDVYVVRMGRGVSRFPATDEAERCVICWWTTDPHDMRTHEIDGAPAINTAELAGSTWQKHVYVQILIALRTAPALGLFAQRGALQDHGS